MDKIVYRIVSFMVLLALTIALFDECTGYVKRTAEDFMNSLYNPLKSCSSDNDVSNTDIDKADPIEFKYYITAQIVKQQNEIKNISTSIANISQEITPVSVLVNNCNQTIENQSKYISQTNINQTTLLQWVQENNSNMNRLESQYSYLASRIDNIKSEIKELKNQLASLKKAVSRKHYEKENSKIMDASDFAKMKKDLESEINELSGKIDALTKELRRNTSSMSKLKASVDDCIAKIEKLNKELDKAIGNGGGTTPPLAEDKTYYFIIGTEDDLKSKEVISSGGLFGGLKVNPNPNKDLFGLLTDKNKSILLGSGESKFEVLSDMPSDSYEIRTINRTALIAIKDLEEFWSKTEFLIILQIE